MVYTYSKCTQSMQTGNGVITTLGLMLPIRLEGHAAGLTGKPRPGALSIIGYGLSYMLYGLLAAGKPIL